MLLKFRGRGQEGVDRGDGGRHGRRGGSGGGGGGGGYGADLDGWEVFVDGHSRRSARDLAVMFAQNAGKGADTLRAGAKSSRHNARSSAIPEPDGPVPASDDSEARISFKNPSPVVGQPSSPPSSSPPDPPVEGTKLRRSSSRLELLRARTNGAGVGINNDSGARGGGSLVAPDGVLSQRHRIGGENGGFEEDLEAKGSLARTSESAASIRSGLTLPRNVDHGGLLSKSGSLRLMAVAGGRKQQSCNPAGKDATDRTEVLHGGKKHETVGRPTMTIPRPAQGASGDFGRDVSSWYRIDIGGDDGGRGGSSDRDDGRASAASKQRSRASKPAPARTSTAKIAATSDTAGPAGVKFCRAMSDMALEALGSPQPHGSSNNHPEPSPASISGYSTPPFAERRRRAFFGSPRPKTSVAAGADSAAASSNGLGAASNSWSRPRSSSCTDANIKAQAAPPVVAPTVFPISQLATRFSKERDRTTPPVDFGFPFASREPGGAGAIFRKIQSYMGDSASGDSSEGPGDEATLRGILLCGRSNPHLACELYCQLVKQTHRCANAENEERGFVLLACTAFMFPPPTDAIAGVVLGHLALHRTRNSPVGGLALYTHHHMSNRREAWAPVLENDPLTPISERTRDCARNCFIPGTVFGVTLAETLRQEYYAVGVGAVTSPAPPEASESARVPIMVQLLVQTIELLGGVRTEGIFRRPGHAGAKAALMQAISAGDYSVLRRLRDEGRLVKGELLGDEDFEVDVYTVADTLKTWLRGMKEPLVPSDSYERAVAAGRLPKGKGARQEEAMRVLLALPPPNSVTLDFLARFLSKVADQEKNNRMNAKGLAVVLSPNLLRNPEGDPLIFKANATAEAFFVESLIEGSRQ
eukprot:g9403.t1